MNMPASTVTQLPAHLANFGTALNIGQAAMGGIQNGKAHPRISIKQNRFRIIDEQGQEFVVPELHLDVIIVGANDFVSKVYYAGAFNPADPDPSAPDCHSDNGIGPSARATNPQAPTCAACPHAAWGSKLTPAGVKVKACTDSKKLAVILALNPSGAVYELRVPAASMENIASVVDMLVKRSVPLPGVVLRVTFDPQTSYPKILFSPVDYITEGQKAAVLEVLDGDEVMEAVGKDDKPRDPNQAVISAPMAISVPQPFAPSIPVPQVAAVPVHQPAFNPMQAVQPPVAPANPFASAAEAPAKRKRRTRAEMDAAKQTAPQQFAPVAVTPPTPFTAAAPAVTPGVPSGLEVPAFLRRDTPHAQPAAASVPLNPAPTDAALDSILGDALRK